MRSVVFAGPEAWLELRLMAWEFAADGHDFHDANWISAEVRIEDAATGRRYEKPTSVLSTELEAWADRVAELLAGTATKLTLDPVDGDFDVALVASGGDRFAAQMNVRTSEDPAVLVEASGVELGRGDLQRLRADLAQAARTFAVRGTRP